MRKLRNVEKRNMDQLCDLAREDVVRGFRQIQNELEKLGFLSCLAPDEYSRDASDLCLTIARLSTSLLKGYHLAVRNQYLSTKQSELDESMMLWCRP